MLFYMLELESTTTW